MKKWYVLLVACLAAAMISGCGASAQQPKPVEEDPAPETAAETAQPEAAEPAAENLFTAWLPDGVEQVMAETEPLPELAKAIVEEYEIPEEYWEQTKYYYNYVDLNGDGSDEIFAVAVGPYTSGSGGDSGMWLIPYAGMTVSQSFTLIRTPIIVSDTMTNGAHELILQRSGGGAETEYVRLVCSDGVYSNPADAEVVEDLAAVTGKAIISNDLIADMQSGSYLTLADAAKAD